MSTVEKTAQEPKLGDRVTFTGTVEKNLTRRWGTVRYDDAPLPGFVGYQWAHGNEVTQNPVSEGVIVGKRRYTSMDNDEGIWIPDGVQAFTAYLVAYHLSRKPVIVRLDQMILPTEQPEGTA